MSHRFDPVLFKYKSKPKVSSLEQCQEIYDMIGVNSENDDNLRVFDEEEDGDSTLMLVHYLEPSAQVASARGVIIQMIGASRSTPTIIAGTFPYTEEMSPSDERVKSIDFTGTATLAYEGTILRLFWTESQPPTSGQSGQASGQASPPTSGKWHLSTHKKIDGRRSRWSGAEFGTIWDELWGTESPSKYLPQIEGTCYVFLLSDPDNRIVCHIPKKKLYHVGTFTGMKYAPADERQWLQPHPNVTLNKPLSEVTTLDDATNYVRNLSWQIATGVLLATKTGFVKLTPQSYEEKKAIRGNEPNMRMRYLQLFLEGKGYELEQLFPEKEDFFKEVKCYFNSLVPYLIELYNYRYIDGQYLRLEKEEHHLLQRVANKGRLQGQALINALQAEINNSTPRQINAMIKHSLIST